MAGPFVFVAEAVCVNEILKFTMDKCSLMELEWPRWATQHRCLFQEHCGVVQRGIQKALYRAGHLRSHSTNKDRGPQLDFYSRYRSPAHCLQPDPVLIMEAIVDLKDLFFTQSTIQDSFSSGGTVSALVESLCNKSTQPGDLPALNVYRNFDGKLWCLDNRRLFALKQAFRGKLRFRVMVYDKSDPEREAEFKRKLTTPSHGRGIRVKDGLQTAFPRKGRYGAIYIYNEKSVKIYWSSIRSAQKRELLELFPELASEFDKADSETAERKKTLAETPMSDPTNLQDIDDVDVAIGNCCQAVGIPIPQHVGGNFGEWREREHQARAWRSIADSLGVGSASFTAQIEVIAKFEPRRTPWLITPLKRFRETELRLARSHDWPTAAAEAVATNAATRTHDLACASEASRDARREAHLRGLLAQQHEQQQHEQQQRERDREPERTVGPGRFLSDDFDAQFSRLDLREAPYSPSVPLAAHRDEQTPPQSSRVYYGNTWNDFQHARKGEGLSKAELSAAWAIFKKEREL